VIEAEIGLDEVVDEVAENVEILNINIDH